MRPQSPLPGEPMREWTLPEGVPWTRFYRTPAGFLLRFPDLADFEISEDGGTVRSWPAPGVSDASLQHLYLNQVLPLALSKGGQLVFHASAVDLDGQGVAFIGRSGRGKSTLAASFATNGFPFLADDGLVIEGGVSEDRVLACHPSIRLWEDSQMALVGTGARTAPPLHFTTKERFLAGDEIRFCAQPRRLHRVYFLGEGAQQVALFERMNRSDALIELVRHSFLLDIEDRERLAVHFDKLSVIASRPIFYRLDYARRFEELAAVRQAILEHALAVGESA